MTYNNSNNNKKHNLTAWTGGQLAPEFKQNLSKESPFIVTQNNGRNSLGDCVIMIQWPYIVCKIHRFDTNIAATVKSDDEAVMRRAAYGGRRVDQKRKYWLHERNKAWRNAWKAKELSCPTLRGYIEDFIGNNYDEEFDEPRIVGKVPGLNIYLEVLGSLHDIKFSTDIIKDDGDDQEPKVCGINRLRNALQWACNYYRGAIQPKEREKFGTHYDDYQPLEHWHEDYDPDDDRMFIPRECGIGHDYIDNVRRGPRFPHHPFDDEEQAELARLKEENEKSRHPMSPAELQQLAAANVAARRLLK